MLLSFGCVLTLLSIFGFLREGFRVSTLLLLLAGILACAWGLLPRKGKLRHALVALATAMILSLPIVCPAPSRAVEKEIAALGRTSDVDRYLVLSETVRTYLAGHPGELRAMNALASGAEHVGRIDEALSFRLAALAAGDARPESWRHACDNARATGRLQEMVPALVSRYATHPTDPETNRQLGDAYEAAGRLLDAMYHWTITVREDPTDAQAHYALAKGFLALGSLDACDRALQDAFETATEPVLLVEIRTMQDRLLRQSRLMREVSHE